MKKLMIATAAAALAAGAFADATQVYDASLSVKTTTVKDGRVTRKLVQNVTTYTTGDIGVDIQYRKQGSRKIAGLFWGCDCETIALPDWRLYTQDGNGRNNRYRPVGGYVFWDVSSRQAYQVPNTRFAWYLLNRIDKSGAKVEGAWQLGNNHQDQAFLFSGAGFGTVNGGNGNCETYIKSISGNFAGWMLGGGEGGCLFCGTISDAVWQFCPCIVFNSGALTAAYGSWKIKYNSSASKRLTSHNFITEAYNFSRLADVEAAVRAARLAVFAAAGETPVVIQDTDDDDDEFEYEPKYEFSVFEGGNVEAFGNSYYNYYLGLGEDDDGYDATYGETLIQADDDEGIPEFAAERVNSFVQGDLS